MGNTTNAEEITVTITFDSPMVSFDTADVVVTSSELEFSSWLKPVVNNQEYVLQITELKKEGQLLVEVLGIDDSKGGNKRRIAHISITRGMFSFLYLSTQLL